jgi:spore coat protein JB
MNNEQSMQLRRLSSVHFTLVELGLFLDTHPKNEEAIKMYKAYAEKYNMLLKAYEQKYGPVCNKEITGANSWAWIKGPWPWESMMECDK